MTYLIDTNVISEIRKGERCDGKVARWWSGVADADLYLSVMIVGEIRKGIEMARARDPVKAEALEKYEKALELDNSVFTIWEQILYINTELNNIV